MTKTLLALTDEQAKRAIRSYHEANLLSLEIYNCLREEFNRLSEDYGPIANIVGLFFHDLMVHFSGIVIQREFFYDYDEPGNFPWIGKVYAIKPFRVREDSYIEKYQSRSFWRSKGLVAVAAGEAISFDSREERLSRKIFSILTHHQFASRAYLPDRDKQIGRLNDLIERMASKLEIPELGRLIENWQYYARHHTSTDQVSIKERGLVIGTRASLQNRKLAINFLQQNKPVVAMTHGEVSNTIFDEPLFGYAELGFCSTLVDYGDARLEGQFNKPLITPKNQVSRTSAVVKKVRARESMIRGPRGSSKRFLYVPTLYNESFHYGPYRGFEDGLYVRWQSELLSAVPGITIKAHPKSRRPNFCNETESRLLEKCFFEYDVIIFDYYSTAATIVISSMKPVVFFDIGLRNLVSEYRKLLRKRCVYVDIDWQGNLRDQIDDALQGFDEVSGGNGDSFPDRFSISKVVNNSTGVSVLLKEALKTTLKPDEG